MEDFLREVPLWSFRKSISVQPGLLRWREAQRDPHHGPAVCRPSAASLETSAPYGPRSPEKERKQDAYQERLFLFFVTDPHLGLGRDICRAGQAAAALSPQLWVSLRGLASLLCFFLGCAVAPLMLASANGVRLLICPARKQLFSSPCGFASLIP